jgi:tetratricopeptide (TPR) repeat protein
MAASRQLSQRGISALEKNDWDKGESLLAQAIKACPTDAEPHRHYAEALWHRGARDEALAQMREAMRLSGEDPSLTVRAGEMCLESGRTDEAAKLAEDAIDLSPRLACAWCLRGDVSQVRGQTDEALADALRGLEYQRDDRKLLMLAAELYRQQGRPERAIGVLEALRDGYAAGEEPPRVLYLQGLAFAALGRFDDAAEAYAVAVARERPSADLLFALADAQLRAGRPLQANAAIQQALAIDPGHTASRALAAQVDLALRASGDFRR